MDVQKILAPTDFSPHSQRALQYACGLAKRLDSRLHMLHVLSEVVAAGPDAILMPAPPPEFYNESENAALRKLAESIQPNWETPSSVVHAVQWGGAVEAVVEYAEEHEIDLIVIATHGRTGLSRVLMGSVAERIVREAPCPVLTVRDRVRHSMQQTPEGL